MGIARLYSVPEVAALLAVKPCTVRKWVQQKRLTTVRPGGRVVRVPETELLRVQGEGFRARRGGA
jgi:excisionase family DNA binding protein